MVKVHPYQLRRIIVARQKKTPQRGRAKTSRKQSDNPQQKKQTQLNTNSSVALTIPSPGWIEWMQSGVDWVCNWIFPQPHSNILGDTNTTNSIEPIPLTQLNGTDGVIIEGINAWDESGVTVAGGDPNSDGYGDIGVGIPFALSSTGRIDVVSGGPNLQSPISLSDPSAILLSAKGQQRGDFLGSAIDMGNGKYTIGARYANLGNQTWVGKTYAIPGNATGEIDLSSPEVQQFIGMDAEEQSGYALSSGGRLGKRVTIVTSVRDKCGVEAM
jgi:hypothetical protein